MATESEPGRCHRRCTQEGLGELGVLISFWGGGNGCPHPPVGGRMAVPLCGCCPPVGGEVIARGELGIKDIKLKLEV